MTNPTASTGPEHEPIIVERPPTPQRRLTVVAPKAQPIGDEPITVEGGWERAKKLQQRRHWAAKAAMPDELPALLRMAEGDRTEMFRPCAGGGHRYDVLWTACDEHGYRIWSAADRARWLRRVRAAAFLSSTQKLLVEYLAKMTPDKDPWGQEGWVKPYEHTIAARLGRSERTVQRALRGYWRGDNENGYWHKGLTTDYGIIEIRQRGHGDSNLYRIWALLEGD